MRRAPLLLVAFLVSLLGVRPARGDALSDLARSVLERPGAGQALSESDIAAGLRAALAQGTRVAVETLGRTNGFWGDPRFRIPLPAPIQRTEGVLQAAGMASQVQELHLTINRAAEQAVPAAADVFAEAVQKLTLADARQILDGPPDAATRYFERTTSVSLTARFEPIVAGVTSRLGLVQEYDRVMASAGPLATMLGVDTDLNHYVTQKALAALFTRIGEEEKSIREDPAARTTALLEKVFGSR